MFPEFNDWRTISSVSFTERFHERHNLCRPGENATVFPVGTTYEHGNILIATTYNTVELQEHPPIFPGKYYLKEDRPKSILYIGASVSHNDGVTTHYIGMQLHYDAGKWVPKMVAGQDMSPVWWATAYCMLQELRVISALRILHPYPQPVIVSGEPAWLV